MVLWSAKKGSWDLMNLEFPKWVSLMILKANINYQDIEESRQTGITRDMIALIAEENTLKYGPLQLMDIKDGGKMN
jgi:hypothetical protein